MYRKGYFFTLDAMMSLGILIIGSFLIFTSYASVPSRVQTAILAEDVMDFLSSTKIRDLNNPYAGIGGLLWQQGNITNADNTLLQQAGEFYYRNELGLAEKFIVNVTNELVPKPYKFEFWIDEYRIYPSSPSQEHVSSKNTTKILLPSIKLTYGILNKGMDLFGPYKSEVLVWE